MAKNPNSAPASAANLVIGCKLPHGLILTVGGTSVTLNGTNSTDIIGGYGLTPDVDAAFFDAWCKENHQHPSLAGGFIFAQETTAEAKAQAKDNAENENGFEGIDPKKPGMGVEPVPAGPGA